MLRDAQDGHLVRQIPVVPDCTDSLGLFADIAPSVMGWSL